MHIHVYVYCIVYCVDMKYDGLFVDISPGALCRQAITLGVAIAEVLEHPAMRFVEPVLKVRGWWVCI